MELIIRHLIKYRIPVIILYYVLQFTWFSTGNSLFEWEEISLIGWLCVVLLFSFWLILLIDMLKMKIYNKTFWVMGMFIFSWLTPAFYLFQRQKLDHLENSKFRKK